MESQQQRVLVVALGATTGAVAACVLAHKLWLRRCEGESAQVVSSSAWIPQLLLQRSGSFFGGGAADTYTVHQQLSPVVFDYAQSIEEVLVEAQLPAHIQQQDVCVKLGPTALLVRVGQQRIINGCLAGRILPQHSSWKIEGQGKDRKLSITLAKQPAASGQRYHVWDSLLVSTDDAPKSPDRRDQVVRLT